MIDFTILLDFNPILFILIPAFLLTCYTQMMRIHALRQKRQP